MYVRIGVLSLATAFALAGSSIAKPPELPANPCVNGQEPTPIAREFYVPDDRPYTSNYRPVPVSDAPGELVSMLTGFRNLVLNRLTMPLGPISPKE